MVVMSSKRKVGMLWFGFYLLFLRRFHIANGLRREAILQPSRRFVKYFSFRLVISLRRLFIVHFYSHLKMIYFSSLSLLYALPRRPHEVFVASDLELNFLQLAEGRQGSNRHPWVVFSIRILLATLGKSTSGPPAHRETECIESKTVSFGKLRQDHPVRAGVLRMNFPFN